MMARKPGPLYIFQLSIKYVFCMFMMGLQNWTDDGIRLANHYSEIVRVIFLLNML
jgi:hypothetical protein